MVVYLDDARKVHDVLFLDVKVEILESSDPKPEYSLRVIHCRVSSTETPFFHALLEHAVIYSPAFADVWRTKIHDAFVSDISQDLRSYFYAGNIA